MSTVSEIVTAVARLSPDDFLKLRQELDLLEKRHWQAELERTTEDLTRATITEADLDQFVLMHRRAIG